MLNVKTINFNFFPGQDASLCVYDHADKVPFLIRRVFCINAAESIFRGNHAHKECQQLLVSLNGRIEVVCTDSINEETYILDTPSKGLLIPKMIWAKQSYEKDSVLMVLCDKSYDEDDYIRNYDEFKQYNQ